MLLILIIILGCNIPNILNDRVNTIAYYVNNMTRTKPSQTNSVEFDWILTGGYKGDNPNNLPTEAEIMKTQLQNYTFEKYNFTNYLIDRNSTNTVENFLFASKYLEANNYYDSVYIVTSDFHYTRANMILTKIIPNNDFKWILSKEEDLDSRYWERVHVQNIDSDIAKAYSKQNSHLIESIEIN